MKRINAILAVVLAAALCSCCACGRDSVTPLPGPGTYTENGDGTENGDETGTENGSGTSTPYGKPEGAVRILQYNVGAFGKFDESSVVHIARIIRTLDADAVSLNEVDSCNRRHNTYQCEDLAIELGNWAYFYGRAMAYAGGAYGNGVVTRNRMVKSFVIPLEKGEGSEPRSVAVAETEQFVMASTHLDHRSKDAALAQAQTLSAVIMERYAGSRKPVFLAGDMNVTADSAVMDCFRENWDVISASANTFPCPGAKKQIDFILLLKTAGKVKVVGSDVPRELEGITVENASDHYPIYVDVEF